MARTVTALHEGEREGERERREDTGTRDKEGEKREEKALSRSFSLSISTALPAFHGHESIPRDRRRVGRSTLSTSSQRLPPRVYDHSLSRFFPHWTSLNFVLTTYRVVKLFSFNVDRIHIDSFTNVSGSRHYYRTRSRNEDRDRDRDSRIENRRHSGGRSMKPAKTVASSLCHVRTTARRG